MKGYLAAPRVERRQEAVHLVAAHQEAAHPVAVHRAAAAQEARPADILVRTNQ